MPGLTFFIDFNQTDEQKLTENLSKLRSIYKVPSLKYSEEHIVGDSFLVYSCVPDFINDSKILSVNNFIIAMDGDFYNDNELMIYLKCKSLSKLEIIYKLFKKEGNNFANRLNGEFNIIIYNSLKKELLTTNDRFARKPLFYKKSEGQIILSSEKKGILSLSDNKNSIDPIGVLQVFALRHNIDGRTFIEKILKIRPGTVLIFNRDKVNEEYYFTWRFNTDYSFIKREQLVGEIYEKFLNSIEIRLKDKERILLWLSGGFDSRSIACGINPEIRKEIKVESYGEAYSEELKIAEIVSDRLGYILTKRCVDLDYSSIAKIGMWRSEFSINPLEHPQLSFHKEMKKSSDYLISGLPGFDVLNGGFVNLGKIYGSLFNNPYKSWFDTYSASYDKLKIIFRKNILEDFYPELYRTFELALNKIDNPIKLDKWDIFNITERQPNYSNMSDLVEADLFETLHPFCDTELTKTFLKVPTKMRMFQQLSKEMIYKYFREVREIPADKGRHIRKNNSTSSSFINVFLSKIKNKKSNSILWDRERAFQNDLVIVMNNIKRIFDYPELFYFLNKDFLESIIVSESLCIENYLLVGQILSFLYAYEMFINTSNLIIPLEVVEYYN